jgi:hypothetical protein
MPCIDLKPKLRVPDYIQEIARKLSRKDGAERKAFIDDLAQGLVDMEKWHVEDDEDWLQF